MISKRIRQIRYQYHQLLGRSPVHPIVQRYSKRCIVCNKKLLEQTHDIDDRPYLTSDQKMCSSVDRYINSGGFIRCKSCNEKFDSEQYCAHGKQLESDCSYCNAVSDDRLLTEYDVIQVKETMGDFEYRVYNVD